MKVDGRAGGACRAGLSRDAQRLALLEAHLPLCAVALHRSNELLGQRIDNAGADTVETTCGLVAGPVELAARMEHREDDFDRALLARRMLVHRNAAAIVFDGD